MRGGDAPGVDRDQVVQAVASRDGLLDETRLDQALQDALGGGRAEAEQSGQGQPVETHGGREAQYAKRPTLHVGKLIVGDLEGRLHTAVLDREFRETVLVVGHPGHHALQRPRRAALHPSPDDPQSQR